MQTEGDRPSDRLPPDAKSTRLAAQLTAGEMESVDDSDGPDLSEDQAFAETNLFVRYASKGRPMLKDVQEGGARADEVYENLRIERHTQFDEPGATVDGRQFREWLFDRSEYRFVVWLLGELSFELLTMSAVDQMRPLYDALPAIDRVEFDASVHLENEVDEVEREVRFNLVAFDRRGNPLVVANFETSRDPVGDDAIASLVSDATVLGNETEHLAGAFFVTESYFEPEAIAPAEEATEGGLLSRDSRASFVKLSRKRGFHLCLVELRDGAFHLVVPDL